MAHQTPDMVVSVPSGYFLNIFSLALKPRQLVQRLVKSEPVY